jgi:hypothetical protein
MYSLDTSIFMDWQARYYPLDVFQLVQRRIADLAAAGQCMAIQFVRVGFMTASPYATSAG